MFNHDTKKHWEENSKSLHCALGQKKDVNWSGSAF